MDQRIFFGLLTTVVFISQTVAKISLLQYRIENSARFVCIKRKHIAKLKPGHKAPGLYRYQEIAVFSPSLSPQAMFFKALFLDDHTFFLELFRIPEIVKK